MGCFLEGVRQAEWAEDDGFLARGAGRRSAPSHRRSGGPSGAAPVERQQPGGHAPSLAGAGAAPHWVIWAAARWPGGPDARRVLALALELVSVVAVTRAVSASVTSKEARSCRVVEWNSSLWKRG
ncbi:Protein of unknown function [Gryllus bimaculatus]|nr:Protein of unknown function [Gryllus bimaculatus]